MTIRQSASLGLLIACLFSGLPAVAQPQTADDTATGQPADKKARQAAGPAKPADDAANDAGSLADVTSATHELMLIYRFA